MSWDFLARKCNVDNLFILVLQRYFLELFLYLYIYLYTYNLFLSKWKNAQSLLVYLFICTWNLSFRIQVHFKIQIEKKKSSLMNLNFFPS